MIRIFTAVLIAATAALPVMAAGDVTPVPEPATMLLVGGGLAAAILIVRKRQGRQK